MWTTKVFVFLTWVLWTFQKYFIYIDLITHRWWGKTGVQKKKKKKKCLTDPLAELEFLKYDLGQAPITTVKDQLINCNENQRS